MDLKKDITEMLKDADLSKLSSKMARKQLEQKYKTDLSDRKQEIDTILLDLIQKSYSKAAQTTKDAKNGRSPSPENMDQSSDDISSDDNDDDDAHVDDSLVDAKPRSRKRARASKKTTPAKKEKIKSTSKTKTPKQNKFTELCYLSENLANIVGSDRMKRSDVVKRMWEIIKERNLYDPKNKQYMICDEEMQKVFGRKRVRTFGMMKFLSSHIYSADEK